MSEVKETLDHAFEDGDFTHEEFLKFTQARRVGFIKSVEAACGDPEGLAKLDPERQSNYLAALRDIEKQVLSIKKLDQDEKAMAATNNAIAAMITEAARKASIERANRLKNGEELPTPEMPNPELDLPKKALLPGETGIGDQIENYQEYRKRTGQDANQDPE